MDKLRPEDLDLLDRIDAKEELRPFFLRKAKGLKWFEELDERDYFKPAANPKPKPAKEEGYINVPFWPVTEYLVATSPELLAEENPDYAKRVLEIIRAVTQAAIDQEFGNYRTWWQFSKIIQNIPIEIITLNDLDYVRYWLDDKYDSGLVARQLGEKWLVALLEHSSNEAKDISLGLIKLLYKVTFSRRRPGDSERQEAEFRFKDMYAEKITKAVAEKSGRVLGQQAVQVFIDELQHFSETEKNNELSYFWRPAIEKHDQNLPQRKVGDILVIGLRDTLDAYVQKEPDNAAVLVAELLASPFQIIKRVAIHTICERYQQLSGLIEKVIIEEHFKDDYRHEMWRLLHECYPLFPEFVRQQVQKIITNKTREDNDGNSDPKATAYAQAYWLAAVRKHNEELKSKYQKCVERAGDKPEHPEFAGYWSIGQVVHESPKPREELLVLDSSELIAYLDGYEDPGYWREPGLEGLVNALKDAVKAAPQKFIPNLEKFASLDSPYVYALIDAFSELWTEKASLPWHDVVWKSLLNFCEEVIKRKEFWSPEHDKHSDHAVGNRNWVVGSMGRLIESGTKSDDHAFLPRFHEQAKIVVTTLLDKHSGVEFDKKYDAVSTAINSPRGRCLEALINLALRSCRLADKEGGGHEEAWNSLQPIFDQELEKSDAVDDAGEYEFITLLVNYLYNFRYMSAQWVSDNLARIFDKKDDQNQKWFCIMQAYAYLSRPNEEIFNHLKTNKLYIQALDDKNLKETVSEKIIQDIVIAYLRNYESLQDESSLIYQLIVRANNNELGHLISFIWTLSGETDQSIYNKILELWPRLLQVIDTDAREGRKLASQLTTWSVFISEIDDTNRDLILEVAPFAEEDYNSHDLLELIARISKAQPKEAVTIWNALLQNAAPDYPEDAIREAFTNLVASGDEGRRDAKHIADKYIKSGHGQPARWLQEIAGK